jgi:hypothetical protein
MEIAESTVLATGATGGIGQAIALGTREWGPVPLWRETPDRGEHSGGWQSCCRYPAGAVTGPLPTALRDRQQQQQQPQLQRSQLSYDQLSLLQWCL